MIPLLPAAAGSTTYGIYAVPALVILTYYSLDRWSKGIHAETLVKRDKRDRFLPTAIAELQKKSASVAIPEDLELGEEELGQLRFLLQVALQDKDDWYAHSFPVVDVTLKFGIYLGETSALSSSSSPRPFAISSARWPTHWPLPTKSTPLLSAVVICTRVRRR